MDNFIYTEDIVDEIYSAIEKYKEELETEHIRNRINKKINEKVDIGPLNLDCDALSSSDEEEEIVDERVEEESVSEESIEEERSEKKEKVKRAKSVLDFFDFHAEGSGDEMEEDEGDSNYGNDFVDDPSENEEVDYSVYQRDLIAEQKQIKEEIRQYKEQYKRRKQQEIVEAESSESSAYDESGSFQLVDQKFVEDDSSITF